MEELMIKTAAIIMAVISMGIGIFQLFIMAGFPLGQYSYGGKHKGVLPTRLRWMSLPSFILLFFFGFVFLIHTNVVSFAINLPTSILVWIITVFLGVSTLGNMASRSKKEKRVMTPLAAISFISCLVVSIFGT